MFSLLKFEPYECITPQKSKNDILITLFSGSFPNVSERCSTKKPLLLDSALLLSKISFKSYK